MRSDEEKKILRETLKNLAFNVRFQLMKRGETAIELSEKAGVSSIHVSYICNLRRAPSLLCLQKIANALGTTPAQLLTPSKMAE
jgi:transcriptional regulator with XRE-family HTH domain